jgi:hypothetical protein
MKGMGMKKMGYGGFVGLLVGVVVAAIVVVAGLNLIVDPFYIFRTPFLSIQYQVNERFAKVQFLRDGHRRFNGYILGSSRIVHTSPRLLDEAFSGTRFYNFSTAGATPWEHLLHLRYFLDKGFAVKRLFIGIDVDLALTTKGYPPTDYLFRLHPHVIGASLPAFYGEYLAILPEKNMQRKVTMNLRRESSIRYDIEGDGARYNEATAAAMAADPEGYVRRQESFHRETEKSIGRTDAARENLRALEGLVRLCRERGIVLTVFVSPCHRKVMDSIIIDDYLWFLGELAGITEYWDFGGYNSVTVDSRRYIDSSHYSPAVSRFVVDRIARGGAAAVPADFGVFVTRENVIQHIERLRRNLKGGALAIPGVS